MYVIQVRTTVGNWSIDNPCHLVGDLDELGYHRTIESAEASLKQYATNDGRERRIMLLSQVTKKVEKGIRK